MNGVQRVLVTDAIADAIREMGKEGAPSGIIYAAVMSCGIGIDEYTAIIDALKARRRVRESNHVLYWIGA